MNEHEALQVLLVKSFETQATEDRLLSDADRRHATREAIDQVGPRGAPDTFIAARAQAAGRSLARQVPAVDWILKRQWWHAMWLWMAVGVGLLVGISADVFGSGRQLNLLAPPAWLVILWNLAIYIVLCSRRFRYGLGTMTPPVGITSIVSAMMDLRFRRLPKHASTTTQQSRALADFGMTWTRASLPLATLRVATLLHVASAAVAIALIAGMYFRGLVLEYRVGWNSTFLETQTVHHLLSFSLAPALWLTGIQLPDVAQMEALREASRVGREQATAAPWIHLYAVMLLIIVVLPRILLACWGGWQARRLHTRFPLTIEEPYFRSLLRMQRGNKTQIYVLPYAQSLDSGAEQHLRSALLLACDDSPTIVVATTTPFGGEDDLGDFPATLAQATHLLALFDLTATPEAEHQGAFLAALRAAAKVPVIAVINESSFVRRFRDYPQRLAQRREAWTLFATSIEARPLFIDLASLQTSTHVGELRSLLEQSTAS